LLILNLAIAAEVALGWHVSVCDEDFLDLACRTTSRFGDTLPRCGTDVGPLSGPSTFHVSLIHVIFVLSFCQVHSQSQPGIRLPSGSSADLDLSTTTPAHPSPYLLHTRGRSGGGFAIAVSHHASSSVKPRAGTGNLNLA
jgi:hypothetical protein